MLNNATTHSQDRWQTLKKNPMIKKITLLTLIFFTITFNDLKAQTSEKEITTEFFKIFNSDPLKAMDYAFSTNKWMGRNEDAVANLKNQFKNLLPLVGDYYGYELITEKTIGESYKLASYMIKYDRQPLRFTFIFYKPNNKWQLQNLKYDDSLDDEIEEAAKQNRN
ncbi:MAG: hypothetical protein ACI9IZ_001581 [Nonlabens sp.]